MIIDPDFLDHWRTRMVVDALGGDELAPIYIMRLWAHCQARKSDRHAMPPAGLKAQCRAPHDAAAFEQALTDAGFVQREAGEVVVLGWAEQNASLLAAWENGAKGGRPTKKPKQNPRVTDGEPTGNPAVTHGEPIANPDETDKSREEKNSPSLRSGERASRLPKPFDLPTDWRQFCETERPDLDPDRVAAKFADHWHAKPGKAGTKLDWLATWRNWIREERPAAVPRAVKTSAPQSFAASDREAGMARWEQMTGRQHPDRAGSPLVIDQPLTAIGATA